jgi:hypothetical protein
MRFVQCLKQFGTGSLKTPDHHLAHSLEKFMAETQIFVAVLLKHCLVEKQGGGWLGCSRGIMPKVWRKEPRPPERIAGGNGIGRNRTMLENPSLKRNSSAFNQVKAICRFARAENDVASSELHERCAIGQKFDVMLAHSGEEWMRGDAHLDILVHILSVRRVFKPALPFLAKTNSLARSLRTSQSLFRLIRFVQCLDQFRASKLKTPHHHLAHSSEKFVSESEIVVAGLSQDKSIKKNCGD